MQDERIWPADELAVARLVVKQHQAYGCRQCTPSGCPRLEWAVPIVFDAVTASWPARPKTLEDLEMIAQEIQGTPDERRGDQGGGA